MKGLLSIQVSTTDYSNTVARLTRDGFQIFGIDVLDSGYAIRHFPPAAPRQGELLSLDAEPDPRRAQNH